MNALLSEAYDSNGNLRVDLMIDASMLSNEMIHPSVPVCEDMNFCSNEGSQRVRSFFRNMGTMAGFEKDGKEKSEVENGDGFVPPGWE